MDNMNQIQMWDARQRMSDYKYIRTGPKHEPWRRKLTPNDTVSFHLSERDFMFDEITRLKGEGHKVVAVSHHLPSYQSIHRGWSGSNLNGAYASELFEYIADSKPDLWIHGHTHDSCDYMIEDTRVICNPRGYEPDDLNPDFNIHLRVEV
jgi:calcineurin-like phosphoesterase family protein